MQVIDGLYIEMPTEKLRAYLQDRVNHHGGKAEWYKKQADTLKEEIPESFVTNNPTQSLRASQEQHEKKYAFFKMLADNLIPDAIYRLSQANCVALEMYAQYF